MGGVVLAILFVVFGLAQIVAAWGGAVHHIGFFWSCVMMFICFTGRFALPITIFSFLGAMNVWGWSWWAALIFAAPGLMVAIPSLLMAAIQVVKGKREASL